MLTVSDVLNQLQYVTWRVMSNDSFAKQPLTSPQWQLIRTAIIEVSSPQFAALWAAKKHRQCAAVFALIGRLIRKPLIPFGCQNITKGLISMPWENAVLHCVGKRCARQIVCARRHLQIDQATWLRLLGERKRMKKNEREIKSLSLAL